MTIDLNLNGPKGRCRMKLAENSKSLKGELERYIYLIHKTIISDLLLEQ